MLATFCNNGQRAELAVSTGTRLRHVQEDLCRIFGQPFPAMKAWLRIGGRAWDDFEDAPFAGCDDEAVVATVDFMPTDDPLFYDIFDRTGLKGDTLEEQILYESEVEQGHTSLAYKDWLRARRAAALVRPPALLDIDWLFAGSWGDARDVTDVWRRAWQDYGDVAFLPPWPEIRSTVT